MYTIAGCRVADASVSFHGQRNGGLAHLGKLHLSASMLVRDTFRTHRARLSTSRPSSTGSPNRLTTTLFLPRFLSPASSRVDSLWSFQSASLLRLEARSSVDSLLTLSRRERVGRDVHLDGALGRNNATARFHLQLNCSASADVGARAGEAAFSLSSVTSCVIAFRSLSLPLRVER